MIKVIPLLFIFSPYFSHFLVTSFLSLIILAENPNDLKAEIPNISSHRHAAEPQNSLAAAIFRALLKAIIALIKSQSPHRGKHREKQIGHPRNASSISKLRALLPVQTPLRKFQGFHPDFRAQNPCSASAPKCAAFSTAHKEGQTRRKINWTPMQCITRQQVTSVLPVQAPLRTLQGFHPQFSHLKALPKCQPSMTKPVHGAFLTINSTLNAAFIVILSFKRKTKHKSINNEAYIICNCSTYHQRRLTERRRWLCTSHISKQKSRFRNYKGSQRSG